MLGKGFDGLLKSRGRGRITRSVGKVTLWRGKAAAGVLAGFPAFVLLKVP